MNILFFIGNGFDLNLGMNTRYSDFYKYYQSISSNSESIKKLKKDISIDFKNWSDLELALGQYTKNILTATEFDEIFDDIGEKLAIFLQEQEDNFNFSEIDSKILFEFLAFPERLLLKADRDKIEKFKRTRDNSNFNVNIITFNYTKSIEKIIGKIDESITIGIQNKMNIYLHGIEHIHGYVDDRMVMGVNDISQIINQSFHKDQNILEALVKNDCNQAHKHTIDEICKEQVRTANLICIFGSSIGETDNLWWNLIGQQLLHDCRLIIFDRCEDIPPRVAYKKARVERKIIQSFLKKVQITEADKESATNKIFVVLNSDMFKLIENKKS